MRMYTPANILYKSTAGRYRPVSYPDGPITARCIFIKNAYWDAALKFCPFLKCNMVLYFQVIQNRNGDACRKIASEYI